MVEYIFNGLCVAIVCFYYFYIVVKENEIGANSAPENPQKRIIRGSEKEDLQYFERVSNENDKIPQNIEKLINEIGKD